MFHDNGGCFGQAIDGAKGRSPRIPYRVAARAGLASLVSTFALMAVSPAGAVSLTEALTMAYESNPTLLAGRATLRSTDEGVPQALSKWRPELEFTAEYGESVVRSNAKLPTEAFQNREPWKWDLTLTQNIFRGGRTLAATSAAENDVKAQRARLVSTEQTVLLSAVTAFINLYRDQATLKLNTSNEQILQRQLQAARDRFEVGEITRTDVYQAEARLARSTADRIQAEGNVGVSRAAYENVMGVPAEEIAAPQAPEIALPASLADALKMASTQNPDVIASEYSRLAAIDGVDEVWGELLPTVTGEASATRTTQASSRTIRSDSYEAKLALTVPLYQSGSVYSRLRAAKQAAAEKRLQIDRERRNAIEVATRAWQSLQTTRARVKSLKLQITAAEIALEGVQREAAVGSRTVLDVLNAEQEYLDAKVNLIASERDELQALFELHSAIGQLTARNMALPVPYYAPVEHYNQVRNKWFGGRAIGQDGEPMSNRDGAMKKDDAAK